MGTPVEEVMNKYNRFEINSINLWISKSIDIESIPEIRIGLKKNLFFSELTLHGIPGQLCVY